jgi:WXXGXW repeat (2 copies)
MREEDKVKIDSVGCTIQPSNIRRAGLVRRQLATCLIGSLLLLLAIAVAPAPSSAQVAVGVSVNFGPPALPYYVQPPCPGPGFIWTPGYWSWDPDYGYYWVPGTWVIAPFVGALWTPGYWGYNDGAYIWYGGYWGPVVGYYGGINYGFGYTGYGYEGGYWNSGRFFYNREVNNVRTTNITNVYSRTVVRNVTRVSYNGGPGGTDVRPTAPQLAAARERRMGAVRAQTEQVRLARTDPRQRASVNHGRPEVAATPIAGTFRGHGVERASRAGAPYHEPPARTAPVERRNAQPAPARTSNPGRNERVPAATAPGRSEPRGRAERSAPVYREPAPVKERRNAPAPRAERPSPSRTQPPEVRRNSAPPREARPQPEQHAAHEHPAPAAHPEKQQGRGNEHRPGEGR